MNSGAVRLRVTVDNAGPIKPPTKPPATTSEIARAKRGLRRVAIELPKRAVNTQHNNKHKAKSTDGLHIPQLDMQFPQLLVRHR